ncbi:MAG: hypothetical protein N2690_03710 [Rhodocyclaceae bacterium]|nr:hypothetical protein [Rhodocyclaceae bacterium]
MLQPLVRALGPAAPLLAAQVRRVRLEDELRLSPEVSREDWHDDAAIVLVLAALLAFVAIETLAQPLRSAAALNPLAWAALALPEGSFLRVLAVQASALAAALIWMRLPFLVRPWVAWTGAAVLLVLWGWAMLATIKPGYHLIAAPLVALALIVAVLAAVHRSLRYPAARAWSAVVALIIVPLAAWLVWRSQIWHEVFAIVREAAAVWWASVEEAAHRSRRGYWGYMHGLAFWALLIAGAIFFTAASHKIVLAWVADEHNHPAHCAGTVLLLLVVDLATFGLPLILSGKDEDEPQAHGTVSKEDEVRADIRIGKNLPQGQAERDQAW